MTAIFIFWLLIIWLLIIWLLIIGLNEEIPMAIGTRKLKITTWRERDYWVN